MIGYGGGTTNKKQVEALRHLGWGMMIAPQNPKRSELRYAVDNGAYYCWTRKVAFDERRFLRMLDRVMGFERRPDFGVCPDKVAAGAESLDFSMAWRERLPSDWPWYFVVQDGMTSCAVESILHRFAGIFVGGTSEWKMSSLPLWARLAKDARKRLHVGRVNSLSRAFVVSKVCGADSFDGTNWNRLWGKDGRCSGAALAARVVADQQMPLDLWGLHS